MSIPARPHVVTVRHAAWLPGMVIINFQEPLPEITTPGGNPGRLSQDGCAEHEVPAYLASLETEHGICIQVQHSDVAL